MKGVIGNLAMQVLDQTPDGDKAALKRAAAIERDAKLLIASLVSDFDKGITEGIPIEAGVLTESLGFKRPRDVAIHVEKEGL